jgi:saccharopine dehydrogenase (NADP+, L-glutamate forming)/spermidine synthase
MKKVLVLGAGLVAKPLVHYLLGVDDFRVTMASRTVSKAERIIAGHERGRAIALNVSDDAAVDALVADADLVISLVPWTLHVRVAGFCLKHKKHMLTTSYVSDGMRALDAEAKAAGLLFLNEIGLDPGIDHMSAMRIIHQVENRGGKVTGFMSYCGGLPAPEANDNPFGYKFSWSPMGVILAGRNNGKYLKDGSEVNVPSKDLFAHTWTVDIEGVGTLDAYPNRDSIPYIDTYGLEGVKTMYRGTFRYPGWCGTWKKLSELGYLDTGERDIPGMTFRALTERLAGGGLNGDAEAAERIEWLGLLSDEPIGMEKASPAQVLEKVLTEKLVYAEGERDMIVLRHEFEAEYPDRKSRITSMLIDFGIPGGDSSMSRTVSLPAAIGARLILEGKIKAAGVHIPVIGAIYNPVLDELEKLGIAFKETEE